MHAEKVNMINRSFLKLYNTVFHNISHVSQKEQNKMCLTRIKQIMGFTYTWNVKVLLVFGENVFTRGIRISIFSKRINQNRGYLGITLSRWRV